MNNEEREKLRELLILADNSLMSFAIDLKIFRIRVEELTGDWWDPDAEFTQLKNQLYQIQDFAGYDYNRDVAEVQYLIRKIEREKEQKKIQERSDRDAAGIGD